MKYQKNGLLKDFEQ